MMVDDVLYSIDAEQCFRNFGADERNMWLKG
jgi:hypothetical protein